MTIYPILNNASQDAPQDEPQEAAGDGQATAYDSTWATAQIPEQGPVGTEKVMLQEDKLFVVLAVVLIIWAGIAYYLFKTERQLLALEKSLAERSPAQGIAESIDD